MTDVTRVLVGSRLWFLTGWDGDGKPTRTGCEFVRGETPRRWLVKADDMLWKVPKSGGACREATGPAGARRDFYLTLEAAQNELEACNTPPVKDAAPPASGGVIHGGGIYVSSPTPATPSPLEVVAAALNWMKHETDTETGRRMSERALAALATLEESIRVEEREECAKAADSVASSYDGSPHESGEHYAAARVAEEIRARKG